MTINLQTLKPNDGARRRKTRKGRGIAAGLTLGFAHTLGEFGVVLMIGGAIPGVTKVASIALYDEVQKLDYASAHAFAAMLLVISFALLLIVTLLQRRRPA